MDLDKIKKIREKTGAGMIDIKKALMETEGDEQKAIEILRAKGQAKAAKKLEREAKEGIISSYIHTNNKIGVLVELNCETDFVARNAEFQELGRDIAMHIAAMNPLFVKPEDVPEELVLKERKIWEEQLILEKKPANIQAKIIEEKKKKFREEISLLSQPFVKNPEIKVGDLIAEKIGKIGENIQVGKFVRFEL